MLINLSLLSTLIQSLTLIRSPLPQHLDSLQMKIIQNLLHRISNLRNRLSRLFKRRQRPWLKIFRPSRLFQKLIPDNLAKLRRLLVMDWLDGLVHLHHTLFQVFFALLHVFLWACFLLVIYVYCQITLVTLRREGFLNLLGKFVWGFYCC